MARGREHVTHAKLTLALARGRGGTAKMAIATPTTGVRRERRRTLNSSKESKCKLGAIPPSGALKFVPSQFIPSHERVDSVRVRRQKSCTPLSLPWGRQACDRPRPSNSHVFSNEQRNGQKSLPDRIRKTEIMFSICSHQRSGIG